MIRMVKFISIPVQDQDRALEFYTDKLGFTILTSQPFDATQRWIELQVAKAETKVVLFRMDQGPQPGGMLNASFEADDVQKTYEEFKSRGVDFIQPPRSEPWGTFALFRDSEGNQIVLSSPR